MTYQITGDSGAPLDAHYDIEGGALILHSRGGTRGSQNARNTDYGKALRLLLRRLCASDLTISGVWVDSSRVQALPLNERQILSPGEAGREPAELFTMLSSRMARVGRDARAQGGHGNSNKRIRIAFAGAPSSEEINHAARGIKIQKGLRSHDRLPADVLANITAAHIWRAVQKLRGGYAAHSFGPSIDYDIIADDGERLPPKAVFGLAASEALGFEVRPRHFSGGIGTICFSAIQNAGYEIVPKNTPSRLAAPPLDAEDRIWIEGRPRLVMHLQRERAAGISRAKKASFIQQHGKLFCEKCGLDPVAVYGPLLGEACIEVHHALVHVRTMEQDHITSLNDLQCLCANCHRIVHRELRDVE